LTQTQALKTGISSSFLQGNSSGLEIGSLRYPLESTAHQLVILEKVTMLLWVLSLLLLKLRIWGWALGWWNPWS
jgi:hypothetical protein